MQMNMRPAEAAREKNNQDDPVTSAGDPDAFGTALETAGDQDQGRDRQLGEISGVLSLDPNILSNRDEALLRHIVCLRLLTYSQIHRLLFSSVDPSFARRRIRQLARSGWLITWEPASRSGGHVRFAHPTQRTLRHVLPALRGAELWEKTTALMLPRTKRRPLQLQDGMTPKWLSHQREVNHLVASIVTSPRRKILWSSSWDSPFPPKLGMFVSPQPDYVLIEEIDGQPCLIFGEHDRGNEPVERFVARKIALYSSLARFPEACDQHFGLRDFRVQITVIDVVRRAPIERLRVLLEAARRHGGPDIFRFTLGGWLLANPDESIWFSIARPPAGDSVAWRDHRAETGRLAGNLPAPA